VVRGLERRRLPIDRLEIYGAKAQAKIGFLLVGLDIAAGAANADRGRRRRYLAAAAFAEDERVRAIPEEHITGNKPVIDDGLVPVTPADGNIHALDQAPILYNR